MSAPDFLAELPEESVRAAVARCKALEAKARDDVSWQIIDGALHGGYQRLGMEKERQAIAERFVKEHKGSAEMLDPKLIREEIEKLRKGLGMGAFSP
jgi:hypothetical protein